MKVAFDIDDDDALDEITIRSLKRALVCLDGASDEDARLDRKALERVLDFYGATPVTRL